MTKYKTLSRKGASLTEYGLVVGLIAIVGIGSVTSLGQNVADTFDRAASTVAENQFSSIADGAEQSPVVADAPSTSEGAPEISANGTTPASFEDGDDTDFYLVKLTETNDLNVRATDNAGRVVKQIALYDGANSLLVYDWASTWDPESQAAIQANDLPAGDYFVRVLAEDSAVGEYTIATNTRHDIAGSRAGATNISLGSPITSDFVAGDYEEYFEISLSHFGDLNVLVENIDNAMIKQIAIYDAQGGLLGSAWGNRIQAEYTQRNLDPGTYYIRLQRAGSQNGDYRITATQNAI